VTIIEGCILAHGGDVKINNSAVTITTTCLDHSAIEAASIWIINSSGSLSSETGHAVLASFTTTLHIDPDLTVWKAGYPETLATRSADNTHFVEAGTATPLGAVEFDVFTVTVVNGTLEGGGTTGGFRAGSTVHITANTPPDGQKFSGWTITPSLTPIVGTLSTPDIEFTMPLANVTATANYEPLPPEEHVITVTHTGDGVANPSVNAALQNTEITLTATADPGNRFVRWEVISGGIVLISPLSATTSFNMPDNAVTVNAVFEPLAEHTITVTPSENGVVTKSVNEAIQGTVVTLTATPNSGYYFVRWEVISGDITLSGTTTPDVTFEMPDEDVEVRAVFEPLPPGQHSITVIHTGNGVANANVNAAAQSAVITLTATPASGNRFVRWEVVRGGVTLSSTTTATATFVMPNVNVEVRAVFEPIPGTTTPTSPQMGDAGTYTGILLAFMAMGTGGAALAGIKAVRSKRKK
jgi:hypothetical protein